MIKVSLTTLFIAILLQQATAQHKTEDVVYLKNGSILRGHITGQQPQGLTKIELHGGSILVFSLQDIDSIKPEPKQAVYYRKNKGYRHITEFGMIYGPATGNPNNTYDYLPYANYNYDDFGLRLHTINGYQFWPYLFAGLGSGIDRFSSYRQTFSPLYLRLSSEFLKKRVTPYVFADAGYSIMWKQKNRSGVVYRNTGGLYISTGAGLRFYTNSHLSVTLSAGYMRNRSETSWRYTTSTEPHYYTQKRVYQRLVVNVGLNF